MIYFFSLIIIGLLSWFFRGLKAAGVFHQVKAHNVDGYEKILGIVGSEDIVALSNGGALLSGLDRYEKENGAIFYKAPNKNTITKLEANYPTEFFPHGIDVLEQDGKTLLYVINHRNKGDFIEVFLFNPQTLALQYQKELSRNVEKNLNDLSVINNKQLVVTRDHYFSGFLGRIEDFLNLPLARILFVDDNNIFHLIKFGLHFANGIYYDKRWGGRLYVAETTRGSVTTYSWQPGGKPKRLKRLTGLYGVDNITYDQDSDSFLIAAHPKLLQLSKYQKDPLSPSPTLVWRIKTDANGVMNHKEVFYENYATPFAAASVATALPDCYVIGSVFDEGILIKSKRI